MDTTMAFIVSMGMTLTGQAISESGPQCHTPVAASQARHADTRTARTSRRIELTNNWLKQFRPAGMTSK